MKKPQLRSIEIIFLTFFGTGFSPKAPGTVASLATVPFLWLLGYYQVPVIFLTPLLLLLIVGSSLVAEMVQNQYEVHDPGWIVIDEVIGMLVTFMFYPHTDWLSLFLIFALFRFFDIIKIWPASYLDKEIKHGFGTIVDDVISGIYAGLLVLLIRTYIF